MQYISRNIENILEQSLLDMPVIIITGPRQSGKTTLAKHFLSELTKETLNGSYLTLDNENIGQEKFDKNSFVP